MLLTQPQIPHYLSLISVVVRACEARAWPQGDVGQAPKELGLSLWFASRDTVGMGGSRWGYVGIGWLSGCQIGDEVGGDVRSSQMREVEEASMAKGRSFPFSINVYSGSYQV